MEYIMISIVILMIIISYFIMGAITQKNNEKLFLEKCKQDYGKFIEKNYSIEQFIAISHFHEHRKDSEGIDDITWHDLNMDDIYKRIDQTFSSAGEEILYDMLRSPCYDKNKLEKRDAVIKFWDEHEKERIDVQLLCKKLGKTGKYSLVDYIEYLDNIEPYHRMKQIIIDFVLVVSLLVIPFNAPLGIMTFIILLIYNMISYFKRKREIDPYITSFQYIMRLVKSAENIVKLPISVYQDELERVSQAKSKLNAFMRNSSLAMTSTNNLGGNPLELFLDYLRMFLHIDIIKFYSMLDVVQKNKDVIKQILYDIGYLEATISIASFRRSVSYYAVPEFCEEKKLEVKEGYHPLIDEFVANSIDSYGGVLVTGSNASGKSTFLRMIAINAILSETIYTVTAKKWTMNLCKIYSSMALSDNLRAKESYFIVEIKSLKRILDATRDNVPVLCFIDEVLRGTNTIERIAASSQILSEVIRQNVICFAATHDVELTSLLEDKFTNYHFSEEIEENDVLFSYQLKKGKAMSSNAISLLKIIGYPRETIEKANIMVKGFLTSGEWHI